MQPGLRAQRMVARREGSVALLCRRLKRLAAGTAAVREQVRVAVFLRLISLGLACLAAAESPAAEAASAWKIIVANDTCPDITWGFTEAETRRAFADLLAAHLDEMTRTDDAEVPNRDHYNAAAFIEVESFLEAHPERRSEIVRRIREGRLCVSPFLCNSLWGFQSAEGVLRTFYPARRMERQLGVKWTVAEHIELPSLPWGVATLLAGSGIRWVSVPFLDYDAAFKGLTNPPLFRWQGPDDSEVRVCLDQWASLKANYRQGGYLLERPERVQAEWIPHYESLGADYPLRTIFASGTHSDIHPKSGAQARVFVEALAEFNRTNRSAVTLANGTLAQFCAEVDAAEAQSSFLPRLRGCFGHSWELWPVSLAAIAAAAREQERRFLAAESLVAVASRIQPALAAHTRSARERGEWLWAMLGDHAWNGTDLTNKRHNAALRRAWADGLAQTAQHITEDAWTALGLTTDPSFITVFNPASFARDILVDTEVPAGVSGVKGRPADLRTKDGTRRVVFVAPRVPPYGFRQFRLQHAESSNTAASLPSADENGLESRFYRLKVDRQTGGLTSLVHCATGQELVRPNSGRSLGQTVFNDGREHRVSDVRCRTWGGRVSREIEISGRMGELRVTNLVTLYPNLDRVDFDVRLEKPTTTNEQRLLHYFPIGDGVNDLRIETTAALLRPRPQPAGDLLPGADLRRFAVQGMIDYAPSNRVGVTIAALDAFMLRLDQGPLAFEALGNDQNWREVTQDQDGVRHFRFRYSLRAHPAGDDGAAALAWSRGATAPLIAVMGRLPTRWLNRPSVSVDPARGLLTCLKPADGGNGPAVSVRVWETAGTGVPLRVNAPGYRNAIETDLLERERGSLPMQCGALTLPTRGHGFSAAILTP